MKLLFFGQTAEIVGTREIEISLDFPVAAETVFSDVLDKYPRLKANKLLFAINEEYANGAELVSDTDELAIFTAVSGG